MLVGGLSRGVRGGQTRRPVGSGVSHLLTCYKTQEQHDVYVYVGLCICRSVTPNSGVKSEKHFNIELTVYSLSSERTFTSPGPGHLIAPQSLDTSNCVRSPPEYIFVISYSCRSI